MSDWREEDELLNAPLEEICSKWREMNSNRTYFDKTMNLAAKDFVCFVLPEYFRKDKIVELVDVFRLSAEIGSDYEYTGVTPKEAGELDFNISKDTIDDLCGIAKIVVLESMETDWIEEFNPFDAFKSIGVDNPTKEDYIKAITPYVDKWAMWYVTTYLVPNLGFECKRRLFEEKIAKINK